MTTIQRNGSLNTSIQNHIATIEFGHPASNSLPKQLLNRLVQEFNKLSKNKDVFVIILKSEGKKTFCAGAYFDELLAITNDKEGTDFFMGFANVINAMRTCKKLIIGRVQGKCVGGGVGLVCACDYVLATESASVKLSEFTIGIGPFVIAPAVERKIGISGLSELTLIATEWKNAYWAKQKGLYAKVFQSQEELDKETKLLSEKLASYNPKAIVQMKSVLWEGTEHWEYLLAQRAKISGELVLSDFSKKTISKFKK